MAITAIVGSMFSGKSHELIRRASCWKAAGSNVSYYRPMIDTRSDKLESRNGSSHPAIPLGCDLTLDEYFRVFSMSYDVVVVDEGQFLPRYVAPVIKEVFWNRDDQHLIISGLTRDFEGKQFGLMSDILYLADEIIQCRAVCNKCKQQDAGTRTGRKSSATGQVLIGSDEYEALCPRCYGERA